MTTFPPGANVKGGLAAAPVLSKLAEDFYAPIVPIVMKLHGDGRSLREIAVELERLGIEPRQGMAAGWSASQVRRVLLRGQEEATKQQSVAVTPAKAKGRARSPAAKPVSPTSRKAPASATAMRSTCFET